MTCPRCQGLMYRERMFDMWACIQCGERRDDLILLNRRLQAQFQAMPAQKHDRLWHKIQREVARVA